jgi:hypothetical protein
MYILEKQALIHADVFNEREREREREMGKSGECVSVGHGCRAFMKKLLSQPFKFSDEKLTEIKKTNAAWDDFSCRKMF